MKKKQRITKEEYEEKILKMKTEIEVLEQLIDYFNLKIKKYDRFIWECRLGLEKLERGSD